MKEEKKKIVDMNLEELEKEKKEMRMCLLIGLLLATFLFLVTMVEHLITEHINFIGMFTTVTILCLDILMSNIIWFINSLIFFKKHCHKE